MQCWKKEYKKWRERAKRGLPQLANRVFALRSKWYMGCGFHYDLEAQLGWIIWQLNSPEQYPKDNCCAIAQQINLEHLYQQIKEIEQAKNYDYVVVNNDFLTSVNTIYELIKSEREKREL